MICDEIAVCSGLGFPAAALGLPANRWVLMIGEPIADQFDDCDRTRTLVCASAATRVGHLPPRSSFYRPGQNSVGANGGYPKQLVQLNRSRVQKLERARGSFWFEDRYDDTVRRGPR
jgi:hypothetical protein